MRTILWPDQMRSKEITFVYLFNVIHTIGTTSVPRITMYFKKNLDMLRLSRHFKVEVDLLRQH